MIKNKIISKIYKKFKFYLKVYCIINNTDKILLKNYIIYKNRVFLSTVYLQKFSLRFNFLILSFFLFRYRRSPTKNVFQESKRYV